MYLSAQRVIFYVFFTIKQVFGTFLNATKRILFPLVPPKQTWCRSNTSFPPHFPHCSGTSCFSSILSGFWHSGSQVPPSMLDIHPLYPPWFFDSSQAPYQGRFLNATKRHLFMRHSPSSTLSTFSSTKSPHFPSISSFGWMNFSNNRSSIKYCTPLNPRPGTWHNIPHILGWGYPCK